MGQELVTIGSSQAVASWLALLCSPVGRPAKGNNKKLPETWPNINTKCSAAKTRIKTSEACHKQKCAIATLIKNQCDKTQINISVTVT